MAQRTALRLQTPCEELLSDTEHQPLQVEVEGQQLLSRCNRQPTAEVPKRTQIAISVAYHPACAVAAIFCVLVLSAAYWAGAWAPGGLAAVTAVTGCEAVTPAAVVAATAADGARCRPAGCQLGTAPGTWVNDAPAGAKWQLLAAPGTSCQLVNYIAAYTEASNAAPAGSSSEEVSTDTTQQAVPTGAGAGTSSISKRLGHATQGLHAPLPSPHNAAADATDDMTSSGDSSSSSSSSSSSTSPGGGSAGQDPTVAPPLRVLMLSDSVDRYILEHLCSHLGGVKVTTALPQAAARGGGSDGQEDSTSWATSSGAANMGVHADTPHLAGTVGGGSNDSSSGSDASEGGARRLAGAPGPSLDASLQWMEDDPSWDVHGHDKKQWQPQVEGGHNNGPSTDSSSSSSQGPGQRAVRSTGAPTAGDSQSGHRGRRADGPSPLGRTAYAFHSCVGAGRLRLASSYFPGVHPTGPFHRGVVQTAAQRLAASAELWARYSPGAGPQVVVVSSCLWDIARLARHEPEAVSGPELAPGLLAAWAVNFTQVVALARATFPEARVWLTHTTLPPRHGPATGIMDKPYLGRAYYIHQLNAALAAAAAGPAQLTLVDYAALGRRWAAGQAYLVDAIHPNQVVGLEAANLLLNVAVSMLEGGTSLQGSGGGLGSSSNQAREPG